MKIKNGRIHVGAAGRATQIISELEATDRLDWNATLGGWFLQCPGQSPAWDKFGLSVIHLRTIEGVKPPQIRREGATHELFLIAYHPGKEPRPDDHKTWQHLVPLNFVWQLILPSDEAAIEILDVCARAVADGILWAEPPLSGQKEPWRSHLLLLEDHAAGKHERAS